MSKTGSARGAKTAVAIIVAVLLAYFGFIGYRGFVMIASGEPAFIGLGLAVLVVPMVGAWLTWTSLRAGLEHQHLARRMFEEGITPDTSALPRRPSGRVERAAADAWFAEVAAGAEADPENWRSHYRLAIAYDTAGDRRRAREAMATAVDLERTEGPAR